MCKVQKSSGLPLVITLWQRSRPTSILSETSTRSTRERRSYRWLRDVTLVCYDKVTAQDELLTFSRYTEDIYDGIGLSLGNPWYLTTLSVAHVLSRALSYHIAKEAPIFITPNSRPFWEAIDPSIAKGTHMIPPKTTQWVAALRALAGWGDGFWRVVKKYEGVNGQLDEQINR